MPISEYQLQVLGQGFPPILNSAFPSTDIEANQIPEGYGFDLSYDGGVKKGTIPSGSSKLTKTVDISGTTYYYIYGRLWRFDGTTLYYGSTGYDDAYIPQRSGKIDFGEDAQPIVAVLGLNEDNLLVVKSTGSYVLSNTTDTRAFFLRTDIIQEFSASDATYVTELDGVAYAATSSGLVAFDGQQTVELSRGIRGASWWTPGALTVDAEKKRIIVGTTAVYDVERQGFYRYSGSAFRLTSRTFRQPDYSPFQVSRVCFIVDHGDESNGSITYQYREADGQWSQNVVEPVRYDADSYSVIESGLDSYATRAFQIRITDIDGDKRIKAMWLDVQGYSFDDYGS